MWAIGLEIIFLSVVVGYFFSVGQWLGRITTNKASEWYWRRFTLPKLRVLDVPDQYDECLEDREMQVEVEFEGQ